MSRRRFFATATNTLATVVLAFAPLFASQGWANRVKVEPIRYRYIISTGLRTPQQVAILSTWLVRAQLDVAGANWRKGEIEVITNDKGISFLNSQGYLGRVHRILQAGRTAGPDPRYLNPDKVTEKLTALSKAFPQITRLEQIGTSLQGRPILALLISTTPNARDPNALTKPSIVFDGVHHAREVMTAEVVMDVAESLITNSGRNRRVQEILQNWNVWVVPMLNVDGSNIVFTEDSMWRKNARGNQTSIFGVDINRNYGYKWNACNGSSGNKGAQDYRGPSAGSEPETQALMKLWAAVRPTASLSYHSYSELVLYSYGCRGDHTGEKELIARIGKELAGKLPSDDNRGFYTPGTPWEILYAVDGSSMDHVYASTGALAYTFEINQEFQPPYTLREPTLKKHRVAWNYFLDRMDKNMLTLVTVDGKTSQAQPAQIDIAQIPHKKGELPFQSNAVGYFFKVLDPGEYLVTARLSDGRSAQVKITMNGQPQKVVLSVP